MRSRPTYVTVAAVLLGILSLLNLLGPLLPSEGVPAVVVYGGIVLGVVGLVAAGGLWVLKRWGVWLAVVVGALNLLSAAPGIPFGPNAALRVAATVTVVVSALIIVLVVIPASRRAFAAS
jgi:uncharacterized membrane protein (DUF2068 family)